MDEIDQNIIELQEYHLDVTSLQGQELIVGTPCFDPQCNEPHYMVRRVGEVFGGVPATPVS